MDLKLESFTRLYPDLLYPGKNDRDPEGGNPAVAARYMLDTLNPLSWRRLGTHPATTTVMPAWTFFVAPMLGAIARRVRKNGGRVVMIVHNVADHDRGGWKARLMNWQLKAADGFITHTEELARELRDAGHLQPITVVSHPPYADFPEAKGTLPRTHRLELLCFGLVRSYKGVDIALKSLASAAINDVRLTIAGEIWNDREELLALAASEELAGKVEIIDRYVSDQETAELFARCDAVVAPYRAVTGSGVLALASRYRRPVVVSDLPGFAGLVDHGRTGWLFPVGDDAALAHLLRNTITREAALAMNANLEQTGDGNDWDKYANAVLALAQPERRI
ncbi:MAG: glycosyltransferase family 4 protein [Candidatus Andeanibacterium colombiense]|uniref:Glycosyltransferase family 4 protein n=1 Tax=Candidatus Andeanibacterium colombiense TaxID=3121345 RepID=A0AAJ5X824_9SPHN|nr:MAG: glycosyltransferase family 4 protein [Sphingomonadaceae bacterium]